MRVPGFLVVESDPIDLVGDISSVHSSSHGAGQNFPMQMGHMQQQCTMNADGSMQNVNCINGMNAGGMQQVS